MAHSPTLSALLTSLAAAVAGCGARYGAMEPLDFPELSAPGPMRVEPVGDAKLAWFDAGVGPPVVLVHGLGEHAGYWNENIPRLLRAEVRVIAVDLLGHGRSDKPAAGYAMSAQAERLARLLDQVAVEEPVVLVGHSMGGQIALHLALRWPQRVRHLVLLAPAGIETFTPGEADWLRKVSTTDVFKSRTEAELRAHFTRNVFARWSDAAEHHLEERVRLRSAPDFDRYIYAVVRSIHAMLDEPVAPHLDRLAVPVTVVFGAADGLIPNPVLHGDAPRAVAAEARERLPYSRVIVREGVGHMVQIEDPEVTHRVIMEAVGGLTHAPAGAASP